MFQFSTYGVALEFFLLKFLGFCYINLGLSSWVNITFNASMNNFVQGDGWSLGRT